MNLKVILYQIVIILSLVPGVGGLESTIDNEDYYLDYPTYEHISEYKVSLELFAFSSTFFVTKSRIAASKAYLHSFTR